MDIEEDVYVVDMLISAAAASLASHMHSDRTFPAWWNLSRSLRLMDIRESGKVRDAMKVLVAAPGQQEMGMWRMVLIGCGGVQLGDGGG